MRKLPVSSTLALLGLLVAVPVVAHHSGVAYFDLDTTVEHTDVTVVSYDLVNPHGRLVYTFTDADGKQAQWAGELPSANNARRRGLPVNFNHMVGYWAAAPCASRLND